MIDFIPFLSALTPIAFTGSIILNWLLTLAIVAGTIMFIVWAVTKIAGPPSIPEPFRWIIWVLVAVALIVFLFAAFDIKLP